ncbi:MAG: branched-chain amino acid ABC transporter permease [Desulfobacula sp.]|jgi:branched-chain amino acid transport system permease protein|uniref:branched-chain amino acid ABC transporter permease n=3 Tax=Desulfobacula sp. TaxID=2593537 RepID=UPI001DABA9C4|nr:branched-chain amino acid ABC transporter permease [Desulfobacula sp.]MBT3485472.1 branched-chain amino acid ABC transporter permease [Desulfobacula sp.]MBT3804818.1 branched-chain amino acid ABC transporter permease [Desulfobacula sp.]MBT4026179.1 branched-chain amino acid ABC transporter permease [Desulfobacula sp.]MBT4199744.1 branched-chain amino acid ABC transporter permease [Desulfobacula sp.]
MDWFIVITTLNLAAIYGLLAIGISIIWSSLNMVNMAHGLTFAVSGYCAWLAATYISPHPAMVLVAGIAGGAVMGAIICSIAFLPLHDRPNFTVRSLITTLAINLIGIQLLLQIFGPRMKPLPRIFGTWSVSFGDTFLTGDKLGTILTSTIILTLILVWIVKSRYGLQIRAMMQNPEGAALVGIDVRFTAMRVMIITGALAGLASVLLSQTFFVNPNAGLQPLIKGLIIALVGGLGSMTGAVVAAFIMALIEAVTATYLSGQYVLIGQFLFIIIVLLIRPRGIGGMLDEFRE